MSCMTGLFTHLIMNEVSFDSLLSPQWYRRSHTKNCQDGLLMDYQKLSEIYCSSYLRTGIQNFSISPVLGLFWCYGCPSRFKGARQQGSCLFFILHVCFVNLNICLLLLLGTTVLLKFQMTHKMCVYTLIEKLRIQIQQLATRNPTISKRLENTNV